MLIVWFCNLLALRGGDPFENISVFFDKANTEMELPLLSCHFIDKNPRIPYIRVHATADKNILIQNIPSYNCYIHYATWNLTKTLAYFRLLANIHLWSLWEGPFVMFPSTKLECVIRPSATAIFAISFSVGDRVTPLKFWDRCVMTMLVRVAANCLVKRPSNGIIISTEKRPVTQIWKRNKSHKMLACYWISHSIMQLSQTYQLELRESTNNKKDLITISATQKRRTTR